MADSGEIHIGDVGTKLWAILMKDDQELDPHDATIIRFFIQRKTKNDILEVTPEISVDSLDGKIKCLYVTKAGDLNVAGTYTLQAYATQMDGIWHTTTYEFAVLPNIRDIPLT